MHAIGRPQGLGVELDARVHDAGRVEGEGLQLGVVRRCRDEDVASEERLEHGHRERRAFVGIRSRADLVEEREVTRLRVGEGGDDVAQMR